MTTQTLFSESTSNDNIEVDENRDYLDELVGEGKKFSDAQALAKGKAVSDAFIEQLKRENAGLRNELKTRETLEDAVKRLSTQRNEPSNPPKPSDEPVVDPKSITQEQLNSLIEAKWAEKEQALAQKRNYDFVRDELLKAHGAGFGAVVQAKCEALGISEQKAEELARTTPKAFLALVGGAETKASEPSLFTPPRSQVNTLPSSGNNLKNYKYFEALRRKEGNTKYWSPEVQNEMFRQIQLQGEEKFYS